MMNTEWIRIHMHATVHQYIIYIILILTAGNDTYIAKIKIHYYIIGFTEFYEWYCVSLQYGLDKYAWLGLFVDTEGLPLIIAMCTCKNRYLASTWFIVFLKHCSLFTNYMPSGCYSTCLCTIFFCIKLISTYIHM